MKMQTRKGRSIIALMMVFLMAGALLPASALAAPPAQDGGLDPAVLAALRAASIQVAQAAGVGAGGPIVGSLDEPTEEPAEEPAESDAPTEVVIPTEADFEEYYSSGVSILAPAQWNVEMDSPEGIFVMSDEAAGLDVAMQDFGADFPGLVIFPIFEASAQELVDSFATDGILTDVSRVELEQDIPMLRIGFTGGNSDGEQKGGVIYIIATGNSALGLLGGAAIEQWPALEPVIDEIARSVLLDDDKIDLIVAGDDGLLFDDPDGDYSLIIPPGWYVSSVANEDLRVVLADPEVETVGALIAAIEIEADDPQLQAFIEATEGGLSDADALGFAEEIVAAMDLGASDFTIDDAMTTMLPGAGDVLGIIRLVGTAPIDDGPIMDMSIYTSIYADKVVALIVFGTPENVQAEEETLVEILSGMTFP
jgi:hypothetical protein